MKRRNFILVAFLVLCGIAFFAQDIYYLQGGDDVFYKFKLDNPKLDMNPQLINYPHQKISSWWDIIESQNIHYIVHSGRYLVHVFVQACTSFLTRPEFVAINSVIFCLMILGFGILLNRENVLKGTFIGMMSLFLIGTDVIKTVFGQIAVTINYMWPMTAMLFWLILYERVIKSSTSRIRKYPILLLFFSIFVASLHEGFSIGLGAGLFVNTLCRLRKITKTEISMLVGFVIGSAICVFSPGNFGEGGVSEFFTGASHLLYDLRTYWPLYFGLLTLFVHLCVSRGKTLEFCKNNILYLTVVVVVLAFAFVVAYTHDRQLFPATFCLLLLSFRLWQSDIIKIPSKAKYILYGVAFAGSIAIYIPMWQLRKMLYDGHKYVMDQLLNTNSRVLVADKYYEACEKNDKSWIGRTYVIAEWLNYYNAFSILKTDDKDPNYLQAIIPLSLEKLAGECKKNKDKFGMTHLKGGNVVCSDLDVKPSEYKWKIRRIQYNPNRVWEQTFTAAYKVDYQGKYYYIFYPMDIIETLYVGVEKSDV